MTSKRPLTGLILILLLLPGPLLSQDKNGDRDLTEFLEIHGLVSTSFFLQDQSFGFSNGQNGTFIADQEKTDDPWFLGGDSRNTRLRLDLSGLPVEGQWKASAHLEVDFFGGFKGTGAFSDEQAQIRLRHAYVQLERGNTSVVLGQTWAPLLGYVPASVSHIAFPLGYGSAGVVGWRFPGVQLLHELKSSESLSATVKLAAMRGSWSGPGDNLASGSAGEAAVFPQLEARLDLLGRSDDFAWSVYSVAHIDKKDLSGTESSRGDEDELYGQALQIGGRMEVKQVTLQGNAYKGRAIGHQLGQLTQFGDIGSVGVWSQVGYHFTSRWSGWVFMGYGDADDDEVRALEGAGRVSNRSTAAMIRYAAGPLSLGLEWLGNTTDWADGDSPVRARKGNQFSLSALYSF